MDASLFLKYTSLLKEVSSTKKEIQDIIVLKTGILIDQKDIIISKKEIVLHVTSAVRSKLLLKDITSELKKIGLLYKI